MPHKEDRFILPIVIPLVILTSFLISKIKNKFKYIFLLFVIIILIFSCFYLFFRTTNIYYNTNTNCFSETINYLNSRTDNYLIVSENPTLFYYYTKKQNTYYPDKLNIDSLQNIVNSSNKKVLFVFTRFNSGFEYEKFEYLNKILSENYDLIYECQLDSKANFVYSS